jgi:hypothetical protein
VTPIRALIDEALLSVTYCARSTFGPFAALLAIPGSIAANPWYLYGSTRQTFTKPIALHSQAGQKHPNPTGFVGQYQIKSVTADVKSARPQCAVTPPLKS